MSKQSGTYNIENIQKIFAFDTFICATMGVDLKGHMMNKHGWSEEKYNEFKNVYLHECLTEKQITNSIKTRIIFVGVHNKNDWQPLDSRSRSGKLIDKCIERLGAFKCVKTNLFDYDFLPYTTFHREEAMIWCKKHKYNPQEDIIVALGDIVQKAFEKLEIDFVKAKHPSIIWSKQNKHEYVIKTSERIVLKIKEKSK